MIRLSLREPGRDIQIVFTGLRPGEKLYEGLFYDADTARRPTPRSVSPGVPGWGSQEADGSSGGVLKPLPPRGGGVGERGRFSGWLHLLHLQL